MPAVKTQTTLLKSSARSRTARRGAVAWSASTSDSERLAPFGDRLRQDLFQTLSLVSVPFHLVQRHPAGRRHIAAHWVIEGFRDRLRILARVKEVLKELRSIGMRGILHDRHWRCDQNRFIGREQDVNGVAFGFALQRLVVRSSADLPLIADDVRDGVEDRSSDLGLVLRQLGEVVPAVLVPERDDPVADVARKTGMAEGDF